MKSILYQSREGNVIIPIPDNYHDVARLIQSDYFRIHSKTASFFKMWLFTFRCPQFALLFYLRMSAVKGIFYYSSKLLHRRISRKYGLQIYPSTKIGYGLSLGHSIGIVVNPGTIIGNNVSIDQFVSIGSTKDTFAIIGDNSVIFPMTCVVNDVHIGKNATIGAGAVVVKDVPANATVVGVPAKVINYDRPGHFAGSRYEF